VLANADGSRDAVMLNRTLCWTQSWTLSVISSLYRWRSPSTVDSTWSRHPSVCGADVAYRRLSDCMDSSAVGIAQLSHFVL